MDDHQCSCFPPHSFSCVNLIHSKRSQARGNFRAFRGFDSFILLRERRRLNQKSHAVSCLVGHVSCLHARVDQHGCRARGRPICMVKFRQDECCEARDFCVYVVTAFFLALTRLGVLCHVDLLEPQTSRVSTYRIHLTPRSFRWYCISPWRRGDWGKHTSEPSGGPWPFIFFEKLHVWRNTSNVRQLWEVSVLILVSANLIYVQAYWSWTLDRSWLNNLLCIVMMRLNIRICLFFQQIVSSFLDRKGQILDFVDEKRDCTKDSRTFHHKGFISGFSPFN